MTEVKPVILIHGGAGNYRRFSDEALERRREHLSISALRGFKLLESKGALDAVEAAVNHMEDCGEFNAGVGSVLTLTRSVEMDAGIMDGRSLGVGAVALVRHFKNPVSLARMVMEKTDHIFIAGEGVEKLAESYGYEKFDRFLTEDKLKRFEDVYRDWLGGRRRRMEKFREVLLKNPEFFGLHDTVGAVAIDSEGNVASAVSTGGYWLKFPGRIGDVPLVGCGFYADNAAGAAAATGTGEYIARVTLSRFCCDIMRHGVSAQRACDASIDRISNVFGLETGGIIAVDRFGRWGFDFNTVGLCRAVFAAGFDEPKVAIFRDEPFPKPTLNL